MYKIVMEFKSQICTTKEQSEKLLALGLKKETADMWHYKDSYGWRVSPVEEICDEKSFFEYGTPAWSLHRLMQLVEWNYNFWSLDEAYNIIIGLIEDRISSGEFNKDYLEEK